MRFPRDVLCILVTLVAVVSADPVRAYRPFDGTDAAVADEGEFELEFGAARLVGEASPRSWVTPAVVANWGLAHDRELVVEGKVEHLQDASPGEPRTKLVDAGVSLKQVHRRGSLQGEAGPSVASECGILLPDSDSHSHAGLGCAAIISHRFAFATAHLNAALSRTREGSGARFVSLIAEGPSYRRVRPVLEIMREQDGDEVTRSVLAGAIWQAREDLSFDIGVRGGRTSGSSIDEVRAGLTWSFSSH